MVKQVKRAMKTIINDQFLPEETLHTVLVEAEATINSRLFTMVSDDVILNCIVPQVLLHNLTK